MDLTKKRSHPRFSRRHRRPRDTAELAAQLAPPEEKDAQLYEGAHQEAGAIIIGNGNTGLSKDLVEGGKEKRFLGLEPVVLVILAIMLAWIAFITWQITSMPGE